jgi:phosphohistidine phosphatase
MRHAQTESGASYADDSLRPLTPDGERVQERVAHSLRQLGCMPNRIFCSPRLRAGQTAQITAEGLGYTGEVEELRILDGGYQVDVLVDYFTGCEADDSILCIGHEPDMSTWLNDLLDAQNDRAIHFGTSSIASLVFDSCPETGKANLRYFYNKEDLI